MILNMWFLTQFYEDADGTLQPVANDYGMNFFCPQGADTADEWKLVRILLDDHQLQALKEDPRVVYCGMDYDTPPAQVLQVYAEQLDPAAQYIFFGQVLAKLSQNNLNFYKQWPQ